MRQFRFLTLHDLYALPDPVWLIDGVLLEGSMTMLFGETGLGKTFVSLDWTLCVATGRSWHGHAVRQGPILYVLAEGVGGVKLRVQAWESRYGRIPEARFTLLPEPVDFSSTVDTHLFLAALRDYPTPKIIVVDTLRWNMTGDENLDMQPVVENLRRVRIALGTTIVINHHPTLGTTRPRGGGTMPAGLDGLFYLSRVTPTTLKLVCQKQRDAVPAAPILLEKHPTRASLTLTRVIPPSEQTTPRAEAEAPKAEAEAEGEGVQGEGEGDETVWEKLLARYTRTGSLAGWEEDCSRTSYYRVRKALEAAGKIPKVH